MGHLPIPGVRSDASLSGPSSFFFRFVVRASLVVNEVDLSVFVSFFLFVVVAVVVVVVVAVVVVPDFVCLK